MTNKAFLNLKGFAGLVLLLCTNLQANLQQEAIKLFCNTQEQFASLQDPNFWLYFTLENFDDLCTKPLAGQFLNTIGLRKKQLLRLGKPFVDERSWSSSFADPFYSALGKTTNYAELKARYDDEQQQLRQFKFDDAEKACKNRVVGLLKFTTNLMKSNFDDELKQAFVTMLAEALVNITLQIRQTSIDEFAKDLQMPLAQQFSQLYQPLKAGLGLAKALLAQKGLEHQQIPDAQTFFKPFGVEEVVIMGSDSDFETITEEPLIGGAAARAASPVKTRPPLKLTLPHSPVRTAK